MTGYIPAILGDRYRIVYYLGKKWLRVQSGGFWGGKPGDGWTTVVRSTTDFGSKLAFAR